MSEKQLFKQSIGQIFIHFIIRIEGWANLVIEMWKALKVMCVQFSLFFLARIFIIST